MLDLLQHLIDALRSELQQFGEILALLDQQHEAVTHQGVDEIFRTIAAIHAQSAAIESAREMRLDWQRQLARSLQEPPEASFAQLALRVPEPYRPLLAALVQENNELLKRVRDRAEQNHDLLRKSLDLLQDFIATFDSHEPASAQGEKDLVLEEHRDQVTHEAIG